MSGIAAPLSANFRSNALATAATVSSTARDAVFTSYRSPIDRTVSSANNAQTALRWAWLAAIGNSWNSSDQNQMIGATVDALDKVFGRFGV